MKYCLLSFLLMIGLSQAQVRDDTKRKLNTLAMQKGVHYTVVCNMFWNKDASWLDSIHFLAWAIVPGHDYANYIENGGLPGWDSAGRTQQEAAEKLLTLLAGEPNRVPQHKPRPKPKPIKHDQCPFPVEGGAK